MASFRKNGSGKWEVQVARKGIRRSGTFETKREAERWAHSIEAEILGGKGAAVDKTFGDLLSRYKDEISPSRSPREAGRIDFMLKSGIAKVKLRDLSPSHFASWRDERAKGASGSTVDRDMATMSAAIRIAVKEWGWLSHSPIEGVERPDTNPARDRKITQDEIDRIIFASGYDYHDKPETVAQRTCAAFLFAIETGMRDGELSGLTMDRVFLDKRYAHLRAQDCKNRTKRDVPLSEEAIRIIRQMGVTEGLVFGVTAVQVSSSFQRIKRACLIDDLTFHDSRHEAITRLAKKLSVLELARMVGHKNLNQLLTYYNETPENIAGKLWEGR